MKLVKKLLIKLIFSKTQITFLLELLEEQEQKDSIERIYKKDNYGENKESFNLICNLKELFN